MILDKLRSKQIEYMKAKDEFRLGVLRYFLSQIKNKEIELRPQGVEMDDEQITKVLKKQIKDRKKSIEMFKKGNRQDLVEKDEKEIAFYERLAEEYGMDISNPVYPHK